MILYENTKDNKFKSSIVEMNLSRLTLNLIISCIVWFLTKIAIVLFSFEKSIVENVRIVSV